MLCECVWAAGFYISNVCVLFCVGAACLYALHVWGEGRLELSRIWHTKAMREYQVDSRLYRRIEHKKHTESKLMHWTAQQTSVAIIMSINQPRMYSIFPPRNEDAAVLFVKGYDGNKSAWSFQIRGNTVKTFSWWWSKSRNIASKSRVFRAFLMSQTVWHYPSHQQSLVRPSKLTLLHL